MSEKTHKTIYVYTCFDPLVFPHIFTYFSENNGSGQVFFDGDPGAIKNLVMPTKPSDKDFVLRKIRAAHTLHPLSHIIIINHSHCGVYGLAGITFDDSTREEEFHKGQMDEAVRMLKAQFPDIEIETHYFLKETQKFAW